MEKSIQVTVFGHMNEHGKIRNRKNHRYFDFSLLNIPGLENVI